jgi:MoxR-like ATPase
MSWRVYGTGNGARPREQVRSLIARARAPDDPASYLADKGLEDAVNVAITLGQPLVITGEPGTGKTQLANSIAYQLFGGRPIVFNTKTTSTARDLFYQYDALRHFRDAQLRRDGSPLDPQDYIKFEALGQAILHAMPRDNLDPALAKRLSLGEPSQSVVLIDEVDKAPRDLPNDILNEIESMSFEVQETGGRFAASPELLPIVVFTSNSEKLLPDPILRRCVFYQLTFPDTAQLLRIVTARLGAEDWMKNAVVRFEQIRSRPLKKPPATAELLAWLRVLARVREEGGGQDPLTLPSYASTLSVLAKNKDDLELLTGSQPAPVG